MTKKFGIKKLETLYRNVWNVFLLSWTKSDGQMVKQKRTAFSNSTLQRLDAC